MYRERKIKGYLFRVITSGALLIIYLILHLLSDYLTADYRKWVDEIFIYMTSDIVF